MGNEPEWKVEKQPAWLVAAIKKTITELPGGYAEAAEWLGVTENALFNRLRIKGDQIFPIGWAFVLQKASGTSHIISALAKHCGRSVSRLPDPSVGVADIGDSLADVICGVGELTGAYREYKQDDEITADEFASIEDFSQKLHADIEAFTTRIKMVYGISLGKEIEIVNHRSPELAVEDESRKITEDEKSDAREVAAPGVVAHHSRCVEKVNA